LVCVHGWDFAQTLQNDEFRRILPYVLALPILGSVLSGCAWLSFRKSFVNESCATNVLMATVGIPYALLGLMLLLVPFLINYMYLFMAKDAVDQGHRVFSFYYFLFSSLYLTSFAVIGCAIVVELERTARDAYSREHQLAVSNQSVKTKNGELEQLNSAMEPSEILRSRPPPLLL
jgi:hypothetical protein